MTQWRLGALRVATEETCVNVRSRLMARWMPRGAALLALAAVLVSVDAGAQFVDNRFETVDTVRASDVLTATLYQSAHHQVLDEVGVRQNSYVFRVDTGTQRFTVASKALLEERVHENAVLAQAVAQFEARNKKLATELRGVLTVRTHDVVQILASPFSTAADLAGQLGRNVAKTLGEDPKKSNAARKTSLDWEGDSVAASHRRTVASQLELDVYSRNPRVQEFLNAVVRAREAGDVAAGGGLISVRRSRGEEVDGGRLRAEVDTLVRRLNAPDLDAAVREEMSALQVPADTVGKFFANPNLSPRHRLTLTAYLDYMGAIPGRHHLVAASASATSEAEALAWQRMAKLFALYHGEVDAVSRFDADLGFPTALTRGGRMVLALPLDLVFWDADTRDSTDRIAQAMAKKGVESGVVLLSGTITPKAASAMSQRRLEVQSGYGY